ncbi:hypothetical protein Leryth_019733, partial [Lithospermum erythrorhizon]
AGIDLSSLSIVEGKVCWDLYIDGLVVSSDGNLLDALGAAIKEGICGLTKRGGVQLDMISVAKHVSEELMITVDSEIAAAEASEEES